MPVAQSHTRLLSSSSILFMVTVRSRHPSSAGYRRSSVEDRQAPGVRFRLEAAT
jgi:hypothetical protein